MPRKLKIDGYLADRIFNKPLLLEENKARVIANYLEQRMLGNFKIMEDDYITSDAKEPDCGYQTVDGVAIIQIIGTLVHRGSGMDAMSGLLSYQVLRKNLIDAANDFNVKSILLEIDSGGGEVEGNFEIAKLIREINDDHKPVVAIANGSAFSGAFSLGVSAGSFFVTETGGVGSVGVIIQHVDVSKNNEMAGIKITNIVAGDRKAELSSDFPLTKSGQETLQKEVDRIGNIFVSLVATMRGISENDVKNTQAALLFGEESVNIGFVDGIVSFDQLLESLIKLNATGLLDGQDAELNLNEADEDAKDIDDLDFTLRQRIKEMFLKKNADKAKEKAKVEETAAVAEDKPQETKQEPVVEEAAAVEEQKETNPLEVAAEIADLCHKAGMSHMASEFIKSNMSVEDVKAKIDFNKDVENLCILAGKKDQTKSYIDSGKTLKQIQDDLISKMSEAQVDISNKPTSETVKDDVQTAKNVIAADIERREKINKEKKGVK